MENRVEQEVTDLKVRVAVLESDVKGMKEDLSSIKNNTTWTMRLIVGAIIMAVLGFLFKGGMM